MNVSLVDLTFTARRPTSKEEINALMKEAANGALKGILGYNEDPLVSMDFNHDSHSSIFDATQTRVMDGNLVKVLQRNLRMPAAAHVRGDYVAIAELQGRVTVLGKDNSIVAQIGDNPTTAQRANFGLEPAQWTDGVCNSPHAVAFDRAGNLVVAEWSKFGRVLKFAKAP